MEKCKTSHQGVWKCAWLWKAGDRQDLRGTFTAVGEHIWSNKTEDCVAERGLAGLSLTMGLKQMPQWGSSGGGGWFPGASFTNVPGLRQVQEERPLSHMMVQGNKRRQKDSRLQPCFKGVSLPVCHSRWGWHWWSHSGMDCFLPSAWYEHGHLESSTRKMHKLTQQTSLKQIKTYGWEQISSGPLSYWCVNSWET